MITAEELARLFHETYERLAPEFGYETRPESATGWGPGPGQEQAPDGGHGRGCTHCAVRQSWPATGTFPDLLCNRGRSQLIIPGQPRPEIWIYGVSGHGLDKEQYRDLAPWSAPELAPITVVIPSIPPRIHQLNRALKSIQFQTLMPARIIVQVDHLGQGAPTTRNVGLQKVPADSEAVAFLDDDDYFGKDHIRKLWMAMLDNQADYVYPHWNMAGPTVDPFPAWWLKTPWDDRKPHQTTIVTLVRREMAQAVGFRDVEQGKWPPATEEGHIFGEDYQFTLECLQEHGAHIHHVPERTWFWVVTGGSTSGRPENWLMTEEDEPRFWVDQRKEKDRATA